MKKTIITIGSILFGTISCAAEPTLTRTLPTGAEDIIDYQIEGCSGLYGFGRLNYGSGKHILTDFCLNEETGDFLSAEMLTSLELTAKGRNGRKFEDLSSGGDLYSRHHVQVLPEENIPSCTPETQESIHASFQSPNGADGKGEDYGYLIGYTTPVTAAKPKSNGDIYFGIRGVIADPAGARTFEPGLIANAQGDLLAKAIFDENGGKITVSEGAGYTYGEAEGEFDVVFAGDGTFTMTGGFAAQSLRLKGHEPTEMKSTKGNLAHFRGHLLGSDGAGMLGFGIMEGEVTTASGKVHNYHAVAYLMACFADE